MQIWLITKHPWKFVMRKKIDKTWSLSIFSPLYYFQSLIKNLDYTIHHSLGVMWSLKWAWKVLLVWERRTGRTQPEPQRCREQGATEVHVSDLQRSLLLQFLSWLADLITCAMTLWYFSKKTILECSQNF